MWFMVVLMVAVVAFAIFGPVPGTGPPPRWRARLGEVLAKRLVSPLARGARKLRPRRKPAPDPFEALRLQLRLGAVADEVRTLQDNPHVYAKAHRLEATQAAYDRLLEEACLLAGVDGVPAPRRCESERMREEYELASRGWSW